MPTVAIVNQHTNNFGDDAAGMAAVSELRASAGVEQFDIFYIWHRGRASGIDCGGALARHHFLSELSGNSDRRPAMAMALLRRLLTRRWGKTDLAELSRVCRSADFTFVSPAGSNIGIYKDWTFLFVLAALVLDGVRPVFFQNTIGPSNSRIFDRLARSVLRRSGLFVREQASHEWLASIGLSSYLGVDTALLLPPTQARAEFAPEIGVVPTRLANWHRDFRGFSDDDLLGDRLPKALASAANGHGLGVVLIPHLHGHESEQTMLVSLRDRLIELGCATRIANVQTVDQYRDELRRSAAVVSMRYHGLLLAAHAGVPAVALSYENKMLEAARYMGLDALSCDVRSVSETELSEAIGRAIGMRDTYSAESAERLEVLREVARGPIRMIQSASARKSPVSGDELTGRAVSA